MTKKVLIEILQSIADDDYPIKLCVKYADHWLHYEISDITVRMINETGEEQYNAIVLYGE
jgi:hypothetical protein